MQACVKNYVIQDICLTYVKTYVHFDFKADATVYVHALRRVLGHGHLPTQVYMQIPMFMFCVL